MLCLSHYAKSGDARRMARLAGRAPYPPCRRQSRSRQRIIIISIIIISSFYFDIY